MRNKKGKKKTELNLNESNFIWSWNWNSDDSERKLVNSRASSVDYNRRLRSTVDILLEKPLNTMAIKSSVIYFEDAKTDKKKRKTKSVGRRETRELAKIYNLSFVPLDVFFHNKRRRGKENEMKSYTIIRGCNSATAKKAIPPPIEIQRIQLAFTALRRDYAN